MQYSLLLLTVLLLRQQCFCLHTYKCGEVCRMYLDDALPIFQLDQDIGRFEVTVPHVVGVNIFEDMQDLPKQQLHLIGCQLTSAPHHRRSTPAQISQ